MMTNATTTAAETVAAAAAEQIAADLARIDRAYAAGRMTFEDHHAAGLVYWRRARVRGITQRVADLRNAR